jgi:hypothetical protein
MTQLLVSRHQAAKTLSIGLTQLDALARKGQLDSIAIGRRRLITVASIESFIASALDKQQAETE